MTALPDGQRPAASGSEDRPLAPGRPPPANAYKALVAGDPDAAFAWYEKLGDRLFEQPRTAEMALRLNKAANGPLDTGRLIETLINADGHRIVALGQLAREALESGRPVDEALSVFAPADRERYGTVIRDAFEAFPPTRRLGRSRHLAICGISYCGSTLLERILGGMEGAVSVGESTYLAHHHSRTGNTPIDIGDLDFSNANKCSLCDLDCEFLTPLFRAALGLNPIDWYQQIGDRFECDLLVTSDKNLPKLLANDPLLRLDAIVLFRSPVQAWFSHFTKSGASPSDSQIFERMRDYVDIWRNRYGEMLDEFRPRGRRVFLDFDAFTRDPQPILGAALGKLGIELDPHLLRRVRPSHSIGGNGKTIKFLKEHDFRLEIQVRPDSIVPQEHRDWIAAQEEVIQLHRELQSAAQRQAG